MAVSASLDIQVINYSSMSVCIKNLINFGWGFNYEGKVFYLPVGDEDFNWKNDVLSDENIFKIFLEKEKNKETIGICMIWKNTNVGGDFLFREDGSISINLNINRKKLFNHTDFNWYTDHIINALNKDSVMVESFAFTEAL